MTSYQSCADPRPPRQTFVGPSDQNRLTLLRYPRSVRSKATCEKWDEALIFRLPDEVLVTVLELATLDIHSHGWSCDCEKQWDYSAVKTLVLVCHRFKRVSLP